MTFNVALFLLASYLLGAVPVGVIVSRRVTGIDVRSYGSGNTGTVNVARVAGWGAGLAVCLSDILKGALPVLAAGWLGLAGQWGALGAFAAVLGHNWSVFLRGRGGKGVATTAGAVLALAPQVAVIVYGIWIVLTVLTRYSSVGSLTALVSGPFLMRLMHQSEEAFLFSVAAAVLGVFRHRGNLIRLFQGKENKIGRKHGPVGR